MAASLENADEELFTFLKFPRSQWKALRTTNALERIHGEYRRCNKPQDSLPSEEAVSAWADCSSDCCAVAR